MGFIVRTEYRINRRHETPEDVTTREEISSVYEIYRPTCAATLSLMPVTDFTQGESKITLAERLARDMKNAEARAAARAAYCAAENERVRTFVSQRKDIKPLIGGIWDWTHQGDRA